MNTELFKSKICRGFTKVRMLEAIVRDAYKSGRQPNPDIISALEREQGALLGLLNSSEAEELEIPIDEILISVSGIYQE